MKIALVGTSQIIKNRSINKDLNGGYGTNDSFGNSISSKIFSILRGRSVNLPLLSFVYVYTILKNKGHIVEYFPSKIPKHYFDIFVLYGSIVDYKMENNVAGELKKKYSQSKVGFIGPFPEIMPDLFSNADFIIGGEPDAYFKYQFESIETMDGIIKVNKLMDMDALPKPDYSNYII